MIHLQGRESIGSARGMQANPSYGVRIRRATPDDALAIASLDVATWRVAYRGLMPDEHLDGLSVEEMTDSWRANLLKHQAHGHKRVLVAEVGQRVVGYARVGGAEDGEEEVGLLYLLYVLPELWSRGIGKALLRNAIEELVDLGQTKAILWVLRDNSRGRAFYESQGWSPDGRSSWNEYGNKSLEALCYRRDLIS